MTKRYSADYRGEIQSPRLGELIGSFGFAAIGSLCGTLAVRLAAEGAPPVYIAAELSLVGACALGARNYAEPQFST